MKVPADITIRTRPTPAAGGREAPHVGFSPFWALSASFAAGLLVLLLTVESSLQTSIVFNRGGAWWTPWLYKIGPLSVADLLIIALTGYTLFVFSLRAAGGTLVVYRSAYFPLLILTTIYLGIGLFYNLVVYTSWKTFLYDTKVLLYLAVPYFFLTFCADERIREWFNPLRIFTLAALASLIDFAVVSMFGQSEYPRYLGLPSIPPLVPASMLLVGLAFSRDLRVRMVLALLLGFEALMAVNRISLGWVFNTSIALGVIYLLRVRTGLLRRFAFLLCLIVGANLMYLLMVSNPLDLSFLAAKSAGSQTRAVQMQNVLANFHQNLPIWLGKGLGSTWFELFPIPNEDIFSVGTSVGRTPQESLAAPVKFIFNSGPAALLYKWGFLGTALLAFWSAWYYHTSIERIRRLHRQGHEVTWLFGALIISVVFVIESFTYIGNLKPSLITALLVFYVENQIRKAYALSERAAGVQ